MWAVLLGVLMILAAATSSHAAMRSGQTAATPRHAVVAAHRSVTQAALRAGAHVPLGLAR
jgi:hypothetical protein